MTTKSTRSAETTKGAKLTKSATSSSRSKPAARSSATKAAAKPATKPATAPAKAAKVLKRAVKPPAKGTKATAKAATRPTRPAKAPPKTAKAAKSAPTPVIDPLQVVRPLIQVRQIREFSTKRVTRAELEAITEVARWSGSSRNEQPNRFIAIRSADTIRQIAELGLPQTRGLPTAGAAVVIVEPDEPERAISRSFDDGRAAERIMVAANLLGLAGGISRVRPDVREPINRLLGLPSNRSVRTIVAIGHPTTEALAPKSAPGKGRLPREAVVYEEGWPSGQ